MRYGECNWTQMPDLVDRVVVLPLGSLEQHGRHLPLLTDSLIGDEVIRRAGVELGDTALFLPTIWMGASDHHRRFPGTVSLSNGTYTNMLIDVLESLIGSGFRRILLLNSHGGNDVPGSAAIYEVQMRHRERNDLWLVLAAWFTLAASRIAALDQIEQKYVTHACELETSMVLRLRPHLVRMEVARGAHEPLGSVFYSPYSGRESRVIVRRPFEQTTITGAYGHPELATADKGEALFQVAVGEVVSCIREVAAWPALKPS